MLNLIEQGASTNPIETSRSQAAELLVNLTKLTDGPDIDGLSILKRFADDLKRYGYPVSESDVMAIRQRQMEVAAEEAQRNQVLSYKGFQYDSKGRIVLSTPLLTNTIINLSPTEGSIFKVLISNPERWLSHNELLKESYDKGNWGDIKPHITELRRKIGDERMSNVEPGTTGFLYIQTKSLVGYSLKVLNQQAQ